MAGAAAEIRLLDSSSTALSRLLLVVPGIGDSMYHTVVSPRPFVSCYLSKSLMAALRHILFFRQSLRARAAVAANGRCPRGRSNGLSRRHVRTRPGGRGEGCARGARPAPLRYRPAWRERSGGCCAGAAAGCAAVRGRRRKGGGPAVPEPGAGSVRGPAGQGSCDCPGGRSPGP